MQRTVLITGGTGLFGQAIALDLLQRGWRVAITTRAQARADDLVASAGDHADRLHVIVFDYTDDPDLAGLMASLADLNITHLVNNARTLAGLKVGDDGVTAPDVFDAEFRLDVLLPYQLVMALQQADAHALTAVVNIGSQYGVVAPNPALYGGSLTGNPIQYGVAKAALHHMTKELAARLAPHRIRVNCVAFGGVRGRVDDAFLARYAAMLPLGRMLEITEVPGPVRFLLSDDSMALNGHVMVADGGWSIW